MSDRPCCRDTRCLFRGDAPSAEPDFRTITTETREGKGLWERCGRCGLAVNRSGVDPKSVDDFYNRDYVRDNSYVAGAEISPRAHFEERLPTVKPIADAIAAHLRKEMRVLELGAATGELLHLIRDRVAHCHANEINESYARFIADELGIESSSADYFSLSFEKSFDLVISINTIDHIFDTRGVVEKVRRDLAPGGLFYVEVPNDAQALRTRLPEPARSAFEKFMYQRAHYYSFTKDTLERLLKECGFEIVATRSRHDYSLRNFLHWLFTGSPQKRLGEAMLETDIVAGDSDFSRALNQVFREMDGKFREIMARTFSGETLAVLARKI